MERTKHCIRMRRAAALAFAALLSGALCIGLAGCGGSDSSGKSSDGTVDFADSTGRTVTVPAKIERVAVTGAVSQQVFLTFAPDMLVGLAIEVDPEVTEFLGGDYASLPVYGQIYGGKGTMNKEALAEADPQVILDIGEAKAGVADDMDKLQSQLGIPCLHIEATLSTYDEAYLMLGKLLGMEERAQKLADYCRSAYDSTVKALDGLAAGERIRALYIAGDKGTNVIAKGSFQSTAFDLVFDNLAVLDNPSAKGTGNEVDLEQIALWNPDFIVFSANNDGSFYAKVANDPAWKDIAAIKARSYVEDPGEPFTWLSNPPTVNQILGLQWIARVAYPQLFKDGVADVAKAYYQLFYQHELTSAELSELLARATL